MYRIRMASGREALTILRAAPHNQLIVIYRRKSDNKTAFVIAQTRAEADAIFEACTHRGYLQELQTDGMPKILASEWPGDKFDYGFETAKANVQFKDSSVAWHEYKEV